jgi:hypothetical protein
MEIWKKNINHPGYEFSNEGRIRSYWSHKGFDYLKNPRILKPGFNREAAVNWGLAGMNALSSRLEQNQDRSAEQLADSQIAGNAFLAKPANAASYGDYNINSGDFRENQKVPVQFPGNTAATNNTGFAVYGGYMEEGGESDEEIYEDDLTDEEIAELRAQGYDVEYI